MENNRIRLLAPDPVRVYESPEPQKLYGYSPGITVLPSGRIVVTMDVGGPGAGELSGPKTVAEYPRQWQGKLFTSDDNGETWTHRLDFPFKWARPFTDGNSLYVLGADGDLAIVRSDDGGISWSGVSRLTEDQFWHQAPGNVLYTGDRIYLVMEKRTEFAIKGWYAGELAPILLRARAGTDLTEPASWSFSTALSFQDAVPVEELDFFGVPFYPVATHEPVPLTAELLVHPLGWLESQVVQITNPDHVWHDPAGCTFHIWMRAHTTGAGYAAIAKVVEQEDGAMVAQLERTPSGRKLVYVPCPGGHLKFHILQDDKTGLYWLLSSQSTDSMRRPDRMPDHRYGLPMDERQRLQLHFSANCVDWCFAGMVDIGETPRASRHYASMTISGEDLLIVSRSGDHRARSAHDGNLITFHRVRHFRELVY